jgi:hypothetical protein
MTLQLRTNREGMVLVLVIIVMLVAAAVVSGAAVIGMNSWTIMQHEERQSVMQAAADGGLEEGRARINGNMTLYPNTLYVALENSVPVYDASGNAIAGLRRSVYVGPTGISTGQYGMFGSVVSVVRDANGDQVIRRAEIMQQSFARFAFFTDVEGSIGFGGGDALFGPVHSNDDIVVYSSGATFHGPVTTARTMVNPGNATFTPSTLPPSGYQQGVPVIPMPTTAALTTLQNHAAAGGLSFTSSTAGAADEATMRLLFVAIDLNGDGDNTDGDEGFVRVYNCTSANSSCAAWVTAQIPPGQSDWRNSRNCGHFDPLRHGTATNFVDAVGHVNITTATSDDWLEAVTVNGTRRCFLGGADELWDGTFTPNDGTGSWLLWPGSVDARLVALNRADRNYLFPLSRGHNPTYRGVIHVNGKVAVSGALRGRVTLAATGNIIVADDLRYSVNVGTGTCSDILGLFSGNDVVIADNSLNSPTQPEGSGAYYSYDETRDEFLDAVIIGLNSFLAQDHASGSTSAEPCGAISWGRGCLFLNGGVIQRYRGAVGTTGGSGYLKRYSYDACAFSDPPPYFPTTGRFTRTRIFEVDPTGFNIAAYFRSLTPQ